MLGDNISGILFDVEKHSSIQHFVVDFCCGKYLENEICSLGLLVFIGYAKIKRKQ